MTKKRPAFRGDVPAEIDWAEPKDEKMAVLAEVLRQKISSQGYIPTRAEVKKAGWNKFPYVVQYGEPEFVGEFPVRQEITVLPADDPKKLRIGWYFIECQKCGRVWMAKSNGVPKHKCDKVKRISLLGEPNENRRV